MSFFLVLFLTLTRLSLLRSRPVFLRTRRVPPKVLASLPTPFNLNLKFRFRDTGPSLNERSMPVSTSHMTSVLSENPQVRAHPAGGQLVKIWPNWFQI